MPDILKVTTPMVNKNQPVSPNRPTDAISPFNVQDTTKILQPNHGLIGQNTGLLQEGEAPALLLNLLKDPAVAASYLKNIFLLEEIFKLLPANNKTVTQEIQQMFHSLMMRAEEIAPEMLRQEKDSTIFKGPLFDLLRQITNNHKGQPELQFCVANLLKAINNQIGREDLLDAVSNNLSYLKRGLAPSRDLSGKLDELVALFRRPDSAQNFPALKAQTLALFKDIEDSILFTPKLAKVLSILTHNLSRYNQNDDFLSESAFRLRQLLAGNERDAYVSLLGKFMTDLRSGFLNRKNPQIETEQSKVMESLIWLVNKQSADDNPNTAESAKVEKILHSLLSSPCNFTPLLHFIIPAFFEGIRAFAEVWINPDSDEKDMPPGAGSGQHFLLVIDVEGMGRFEAELFVYHETIDFALYCPPGYEDGFQDMMRGLPKLLKNSPYRLGNTRLEPLLRSRSLMDAFKSLPYKRVGVDVKV